MTAPAARRRTSRLPFAAFLLALVLTVTSTLVELCWEPIDTRFIEAADDAAWNTNLLLPHQDLISLGIKGAVLLSVVLSVITFLSVLRSRTTSD